MPPYTILLTYRYAYLIFHLNNQFLGKFVNSYADKRTREQMEQAARSGKQNIVEGASQGTSLKGYIKLLGIARGSLEELLEDYRDYSVKQNVPLWNRADERYRRFRSCRIFLPDSKTCPKESSPKSPLPPIPPLPLESRELTVNIMIDLITRTCFLLDNQVRALMEKHKREGGFTEKLYRERKTYRGF